MIKENKKTKQRGIGVIGVILYGAFILLTAAGALATIGWYLNLRPAEQTGWFLLTLIFALFGSITTSFASLNAGILEWVMSPSFTSLSYTQPSNPVIASGLSVTQGLANMLLVLVLVFIALATILQLAGYETKKLLVKFIGIALLVNFAPVIVGLVVDASNIIMYSFLRIIFQVDVPEKTVGRVWEGISDILNQSIEQTRANFFYAAFIIIFSTALGIAYLIYAILFIFRYVIIWVLTILSPLAFVAYILPATQHIAKKWWEQLVNWSFLGVTTAFFLYLGSQVAARATDWFQFNTQGSPELEPISIILVYLVPLVFMYIGFLFSMISGAMGAQSLLEASYGLLKWSSRQGLEVARGIRIPYTDIKPFEQAEASIRRAIERTPLFGRAIGGPGAYERERGRRLEVARKEIQSIPNTPAGNEALRLIVNKRAITQRDREKRAAALEILAQRQELNGIEAEDMPRVIAEAQRLGANMEHIYKARPDLAQYFINPDNGQPRGMAGIQWAMERISHKEFYRTVQREALQNPEVVIRAALDERKFEQMSRYMIRELKLAFKTTFQKNPALEEANLRSRGYTDEQIEYLKQIARTLADDPRWQV
jgi:hypothetical protein